MKNSWANGGNQTVRSHLKNRKINWIILNTPRNPSFFGSHRIFETAATNIHNRFLFLRSNGFAVGRLDAGCARAYNGKKGLYSLFILLTTTSIFQSGFACY